MASHDVVVIGASSGGIEAVSKVVAALPADFPAAIFVVIHLSPHTPSILPQIISRHGKVKAVHPTDGDPIKPALIYVAPPDRHLLVGDHVVEVTTGPRENHHRPCIDVLFRSAASSFAERVIGVVLTGALDDGAAGLWAIREAGGLGIVQDPDDAVYPSMPLAAIEIAAPHHVLKAEAIGAKLVDLVKLRMRDPPRPVPRKKDRDTVRQRLGGGDIDDFPEEGTMSKITCPECGGTLAEAPEGSNTRFRCYTGHVYSPEALFDDKFDGVERALWTAVRSLEEATLLAKRLAARARETNRSARVTRYEEKARETEAGATVIKDLLKRRRKTSTP
jgi:two-component system, chemotaxis family, protein-glutamate methylesterase/glutaminase